MTALSEIIPPFVLNELQVVQTKYDINTRLRLAHFLAQCRHESGNFTQTKENLNYSAIGLIGTFPKYFDNKTSIEYSRKPEKIANRVYANRNGNGNEASGDGWKHRGFGYIQLTGANNQNKFIATLSTPILPEQIAEPKYALQSAGWFWMMNGCNEIADKGYEEMIVREVTKRVNGGYNGLAERIKYFNQIFALLK